MRKVLLLMAIVALTLATAAPALAQDTVTGDTGVVSGDTNVVNKTIVNEGDIVTVRDCDTGVCICETEGGVIVQLPADDLLLEGNTATVLSTSNVFLVSGDTGASASASASASAATTVLPETGGASLLALGAGALLISGALLARRIVR